LEKLRPGTVQMYIADPSQFQYSIDAIAGTDLLYSEQLAQLQIADSGFVAVVADYGCVDPYDAFTHRDIKDPDKIAAAISTVLRGLYDDILFEDGNSKYEDFIHWLSTQDQRLMETKEGRSLNSKIVQWLPAANSIPAAPNVDGCLGNLADFIHVPKHHQTHQDIWKRLLRGCLLFKTFGQAKRYACTTAPTARPVLVSLDKPHHEIRGADVAIGGNKQLWRLQTLPEEDSIKKKCLEANKRLAQITLELTGEAQKRKAVETDIQACAKEITARKEALTTVNKESDEPGPSYKRQRV